MLSFASPGIGFLTILFVLVSFTISSACAETAVTFFPATPTCLEIGVDNCLTVPPIFIVVFPPIVFTVNFPFSIFVNFGLNLTEALLPTFPTTLNVCPAPFNKTTSPAILPNASVGLTLINCPKLSASFFIVPGTSFNFRGSFAMLTNVFGKAINPATPPITVIPTVKPNSSNSFFMFFCWFLILLVDFLFCKSSNFLIDFLTNPLTSGLF